MTASIGSIAGIAVESWADMHHFKRPYNAMLFLRIMLNLKFMKALG